MLQRRPAWWRPACCGIGEGQQDSEPMRDEYCGHLDQSQVTWSLIWGSRMMTKTMERVQDDRNQMMENLRLMAE